MKNIYKEIENTIIHVIGDFSSTRERILWATLGIFIFALVKTESVAILSIISGWVSIVLTFYFHSKSQEHTHKHEKEMKEK